MYIIFLYMYSYVGTRTSHYVDDYEFAEMKLTGYNIPYHFLSPSSPKCQILSSIVVLELSYVVVSKAVHTT